MTKKITVSQLRRGERIGKARAFAKKTLHEMAAAMKWANQTYISTEQGKRDATCNEIEKLAEITGVNVLWLFNGTGGMKNND